MRYNHKTIDAFLVPTLLPCDQTFNRIVDYKIIKELQDFDSIHEDILRETQRQWEKINGETKTPRETESSRTYNYCKH